MKSRETFMFIHGNIIESIMHAVVTNNGYIINGGGVYAP